MVHNFYQSKRLKLGMWILILSFFFITFLRYLTQKIVDIFSLSFAVLFLFIELKGQNKPIISIDDKEITIFGSPGIHPIWKKLVIPITKIAKTEIKGKFFYLDKQITIEYQDKKGKARKKSIFLANIDKAQKLIELLQNSTH